MDEIKKEREEWRGYFCVGLKTFYHEDYNPSPLSGCGGGFFELSSYYILFSVEICGQQFVGSLPFFLSRLMMPIRHDASWITTNWNENVWKNPPSFALRASLGHSWKNSQKLSTKVFRLAWYSSAFFSPWHKKSSLFFFLPLYVKVSASSEIHFVSPHVRKKKKRYERKKRMRRIKCLRYYGNLCAPFFCAAFNLFLLFTTLTTRILSLCCRLSRDNLHIFFLPCREEQTGIKCENGKMWKESKRWDNDVICSWKVYVARRRFSSNAFIFGERRRKRKLQTFVKSNSNFSRLFRTYLSWKCMYIPRHI